jgi:hypothetical protein
MKGWEQSVGFFLVSSSIMHLAKKLGFVDLICITHVLERLTACPTSSSFQ